MLAHHQPRALTDRSLRNDDDELVARRVECPAHTKFSLFFFFLNPSYRPKKKLNGVPVRFTRLHETSFFFFFFFCFLSF